MNKIKLSIALKSALELRHSKVSDGNERDRIKAVLLRSEGWKISMIAQALRIHESTITRHINDFLTQQKLTSDNGGSDSFLNTEQTGLLISHLCKNTYFHTYQICQYVKDTWAICYSVSGMNKWLHQHHFSYKQPKGVPHKCDLEKQAIFVAQYESLKLELAEDEALLFMDAVHPTQATKITSGWIRTGVDKIIETTGSRTRLNVVGAIELNNLSNAVTAQYKTINGDSIIDFLDKIKQRYNTQKAIHLVLDGAGYHRSHVVIKKAKDLGITLHYLPPYSPNLNPIERLWKVMNEHARNNRYFATAKAFRESISHFFDTTLPAIGANLNTRINDNFQRFYPES